MVEVANECWAGVAMASEKGNKCSGKFEGRISWVRREIIFHVSNRLARKDPLGYYDVRNDEGILEDGVVLGESGEGVIDHHIDTMGEEPNQVIPALVACAGEAIYYLS